MCVYRCVCVCVTMCMDLLHAVVPGPGIAALPHLPLLLPLPLPHPPLPSLPHVRSQPEDKQKASQQFTKLQAAMKVLGISGEEQRAFWLVLGSIYHLGAAGASKGESATCGTRRQGRPATTQSWTNPAGVKHFNDFYKLNKC